MTIWNYCKKCKKPFDFGDKDFNYVDAHKDGLCISCAKESKKEEETSDES